MRKTLAILAIVTLLAPFGAFAKGYSGGFHSSPSVHVSAPSHSYSGGLSSPVKSTGSFTGGTKSVTPSGLNTPVKSTGSFTPTKPVPAKTVAASAGATVAVSAPSVVYVHSYNPFNGNFFLWCWIFGCFNRPQQTTVINQTAPATTTPATGTGK